jgi:hypothetical protein
VSPATVTLIVGCIGAAGPLIQAAVASWLDNGPRRRASIETQQASATIELLERILRLEQTLRESPRPEVQSVVAQTLNSLLRRLTTAEESREQQQPLTDERQARWRRYLLLTAPASAWGVIARVLLFIFAAITVLTTASAVSDPQAPVSYALFCVGVFGVPAILIYGLALRTSKTGEQSADGNPH